MMKIVLLLTMLHPSFTTLVVKNCAGEAVPMYADRWGRIPLASPLLVAADGRVSFYIRQSECYRVEVVQ